jgi:hypothetical protein
LKKAVRIPNMAMGPVAVLRLCSGPYGATLFYQPPAYNHNQYQLHYHRGLRFLRTAPGPGD